MPMQKSVAVARTQEKVTREEGLLWLKEKEKRLLADCAGANRFLSEGIQAPDDKAHRTDPGDSANVLYVSALSREDHSLQLSRALHKVQQVIRWIQDGSLEEDDYGACRECGDIIPRGRLEIFPETFQCTPCKAREEKIKLAGKKR